LDDEPDGCLNLFLCTVEDRAQEREEHEPNLFITRVFRELCKNLKDQATKQLFAKLLATPGMFAYQGFEN
jgi:aspartate/tyrosine/aromatic aminotransferase